MSQKADVLFSYLDILWGFDAAASSQWKASIEGIDTPFRNQLDPAQSVNDGIVAPFKTAKI